MTATAPSGRPAEAVVTLDNISRRFGETTALRGLSLTARRGEIVGIIGRSGAGKSTLIRCINALERPDSGRVLIGDRDITALSGRALQEERRRIAMVFQHFNLLSAKTVAENVALPLKIAGWPRARRAERVAGLLALTGLAEKASAYPAQLSGGQKQRVGIARALAADPVLLLCDEATSALDPETTQSILALLRDINRRLGLTILIITHEMDVIRQVADRVAVLDGGRIVEEGPVWQVFAAPQAPTTQALLANMTPALPPDLAARLRPPGQGRGAVVLRVDLKGEGARAPLIAALSGALSVPVSLLHGGLAEVQGVALATAFLALPAVTADIAEAAVRTSAAAEVLLAVSVLGHLEAGDVARAA